MFKKNASKVQSINFRSLNYKDFPEFANSNAELQKCIAVIDRNAVVYVNKKKDVDNSLYKLFEMYSREPYQNLKHLKKTLKAIYPDVNTMYDVERYKGKDRGMAISLVMIDIELQRRVIEKSYYN